MQTKDFLAQELRKIGLDRLADKAAAGFYDDFQSPIPLPELQLSNDLLLVGTPEAMALRRRHHAGEFDATHEESEAWAASPDGQEAMRQLLKDEPK